MNFDKSFGYLILISGITIIIITIIYSFSIFTGKTDAPNIFKKEISITQNSNIKVDNLNQENMKDFISETVQENINKILPENFTTKIINLSCWGAFAGIAIFGGGKIGGLGINLITKSKKEEKDRG